VVGGSPLSSGLDAELTALGGGEHRAPRAPRSLERTAGGSRTCYFSRMDNGPEARAARRRATWNWECRVAKTFAEHEQDGLDFWADAPSSAKLDAMWDLIVEAWLLGGKRGPAPRFQGSVVAIRRFER